MAGQRLGEILRETFPQLSSRQVVLTVNNGLVTKEKVVQENLDSTFKKNDILQVDLRHGVKGRSKPKHKPIIEHVKVLMEDEHVVVVKKAPGVVVQPSGIEPNAKNKKKKKDIPPLIEILKHYWKKQGMEAVNPYLVHRLDKETSGIMVLAKTLPASKILQRLAAGRNMERRYVALVEGVMKKDKGTWESYLYEDETGWKHSFEQFKRHVTDEEKVPEGSKLAITHFKVLERHENLTLLDLRLETGRTHQIRIHCAESAHPVVGDYVYSKLAKSKFPAIPFGEGIQKPNRMMLHAIYLKFQHPKKTTRWITQKDEIPEDFMKYVEKHVKKPKKVAET